MPIDKEKTSAESRVLFFGKMKFSISRSLLSSFGRKKMFHSNVFATTLVKARLFSLDSFMESKFFGSGQKMV